MEVVYCVMAIAALAAMLIVMRRLQDAKRWNTYWRNQYRREYDLRVGNTKKYDMEVSKVQFERDNLAIDVARLSAAIEGIIKENEVLIAANKTFAKGKIAPEKKVVAPKRKHTKKET